MLLHNSASAVQPYMHMCMPDTVCMHMCTFAKSRRRAHTHTRHTNTAASPTGRHRKPAPWGPCMKSRSLRQRRPSMGSGRGAARAGPACARTAACTPQPTPPRSSRHATPLSPSWPRGRCGHSGRLPAGSAATPRRRARRAACAAAAWRRRGRLGARWAISDGAAAPWRPAQQHGPHGPRGPHGPTRCAPPLSLDTRVVQVEGDPPPKLGP
jgi:hypothetical protein